VQRKADLGRNQREDIDAQGKTHNLNSKQRKFQVREVNPNFRIVVLCTWFWWL